MLEFVCEAVVAELLVSCLYLTLVVHGILTAHILGPESELSNMSTFITATAEALIDLYHECRRITNSYTGHPSITPPNSIWHPVLVEEVDDVDCTFSYFREHITILTFLIKLCPSEAHISLMVSIFAGRSPARGSRCARHRQ